MRVLPGALVALAALLAANHASGTALEKRTLSKQNAAFLEWFESDAVGGTAAGVDLAEFDGMGRGVRATRQLRDKDVVMRIPLERCLSRKSAAAHHNPAVGKLLLGFRDDSDLVAAFLLREAALGPASRWAPYIAVLPAEGSLPLPLTFSASELDALHDERERLVALDAQQKARRRHQNALAALEKLLAVPEPALPGGSGGGAHTIEPRLRRRYLELRRWHWASALVSSRALTLRGKRFLVPFADMFNYAQQPAPLDGSLRDHANGAHFLTYHVLDEARGEFRVLADRAAAPSEQLFEDYGDNDNYLYLHYHGFVPDANQFDCVKLRLPHLFETRSVKADPAGFKHRASLLRFLRTTPNPSACINAARPLPLYIRNWLLVSSMTEAEAASCVSFLDMERSWNVARCVDRDRGEGGEDDEGGVGAVSRWAGALLPLLEAQKKAAYTSASDDRSILASAKASAAADGSPTLSVELTHNERLALQFRLGRKQLLDALVFAMREKVDDAQHTKAGLKKPKKKDKKKKKKHLSAERKQKKEKRDEEAEAKRKAQRQAANKAGSGSGSGDGDEDEDEETRYSRKAKRLNDWIDEMKFPVNKLTVRYVPGMRLGTIATADIKAEDVYISVPPQAVLNRASAKKCDVLGPVFEQLAKKFPRGDAFHELLFHLVYERFVRGARSNWAPYLDVLPQIDEMVSPAYYTDDELALLKGSVLHDRVVRYRQKINRSFDAVSEHVLSQYPAAFSPSAADSATPRPFSFEHYKWAHCILDSRAIWWAGQRNLVPLLDMINCKEGPDGSRVHSTKLDAAGVNAVTRAPWSFGEGEQVFENYGQPNHIYMQYHGFVLTSNAHDCVLLELDLPRSLLDAKTEAGRDAMQRLREIGVRGPGHEFCLKAAPPPPSLLEFLRVKLGLPERNYNPAAANVAAESAHDARVFRELRRILRGRLKGYAMDRKAVREQLDKGGAALPFKRKMALLFVSMEMELLDGVDKYLKWDEKAFGGGSDEL